MAKTSKGVRQVNEHVIQKGRALIVTTEDFNDYNWSELPDGSLHVDTNTGNIMVKLKGESTWVPSGLKDDGTLVISRDTQFCDEVFTITSIDEKNNTFIYTNSKDEQRHKTFDKNGFVFELENGTYLMQRNHIEVTIDGILTRTVMNGGVEEISERKIKVLDNLIVGQIIAIKYVKWVKIGSPYPRIFLNPQEPEDPEIGDFWLDPNGSLIEGSLEEDLNDNPSTLITWDKISGKPTSLTGYNIKDPVAMTGHVHRLLDITDFPSRLENKEKEKSLEILDDRGYIYNNLISDELLESNKLLYIQDTRPSAPKNKAIWICTDNINNTPHIEIFIDMAWLKIS